MKEYNEELVKHYGGYTTTDYFYDLEEMNEEAEYFERINEPDIDCYE